MSDEELQTPYKEMAEIVRLYRVVTGFAERQWVASKVAADDQEEIDKLANARCANFPEGNKKFDKKG